MQRSIHMLYNKHEQAPAQGVLYSFWSAAYNYHPTIGGLWFMRAKGYVPVPDTPARGEPCYFHYNVGQAKQIGEAILLPADTFPEPSPPGPFKWGECYECSLFQPKKHKAGRRDQEELRLCSIGMYAEEYVTEADGTVSSITFRQCRRRRQRDHG
jgi:hypothetical protein